MMLTAIKFMPIQGSTKAYLMLAVMLALVVTTLFMPEMAHAAYNTAEITSEFDEGEEPVGAVAAASAEMLVIRRIWRIIKSSI